MNAKSIFLSFLFTIVLAWSKIQAQCAMCRGAAETSLQNGNSQASGINTGVLYVLVIVLSLVCGVGFFFWKHRNAHGQYK